MRRTNAIVLVDDYVIIDAVVDVGVDVCIVVQRDRHHLVCYRLIDWVVKINYSIIVARVVVESSENLEEANFSNQEHEVSDFCTVEIKVCVRNNVVIKELCNPTILVNFIDQLIRIITGATVVMVYNIKAWSFTEERNSHFLFIFY